MGPDSSPEKTELVPERIRIGFSGQEAADAKGGEIPEKTGDKGVKR